MVPRMSRHAEIRKQRREHAEALREAVRDEVQRQMTTLGLATKDDLAAVGRTIGDELARGDAETFGMS